MKKIKYVFDIVIIIFSAILSGVAFHSFVNPAEFAPTGIDGLAAMAQYLLGINMGYITLAINVPLLIAAWFIINKKYVVYTLIYTVTSSFTMIVMENVQFYEYHTENNLWISVLVSGILLGARTALLIRIGGSSGGNDVIASMIQKNRPYLNIESIITYLAYIPIVLSFFVYGNIESAIMTVAQKLVFNAAMNSFLKSTRNAIKVTIITSDVENFRDDILHRLRHGATIVDCEGMFSGDAKKMIITIINIRQMKDLIKISKRYPNTFIYFDDVSGVWGNFKWIKRPPEIVDNK